MLRSIRARMDRAGRVCYNERRSEGNRAALTAENDMRTGTARIHICKNPAGNTERGRRERRTGR